MGGSIQRSHTDILVVLVGALSVVGSLWTIERGLQLLGGSLSSSVLVGVGTGMLLTGSADIINSRSHPGGAPLGPKRKRPKVYVVPRFLTKPLVKSLTTSVSEDMIAAGFVVNPVVYITKFVLYATGALAVVVPISLILFYSFKEPLYLLLNLIPILILMTPRLHISSKKSTTLSGVEDELPYFAMFAAVFQSAGIALYKAFEEIVGKGIFRWMEIEGQLIKKDRELFGKTETEALNERARQHPSELFSTYIQGYTSILLSGGDVADYLQSKLKEFLTWTEFRWKSYANSASDIGETVISIFFVLPLLILSVAFVYPDAMVDIIALMIVLVLPMLTAASYIVVDRAQPKTNDLVVGSLPLAMGSGAAGGVFAYFLAAPYWVVLATGIGIFSALFGWSTLFQVREMRETEKALPRFLRDLTEYKKIGYDVPKAIHRVAREGSYNPAFDYLILDVSRQLELGSRLKEVVLKTKSWMTRMVFHTLGVIVESGGGTPFLLEMVTEFTRGVQAVLKETRARMRVYEILMYAAPVGLSLTIVLLQFMMSSFSGVVASGESVGIIGNISSASPVFLDLTQILILEAAVAAALLGSKAIDFTSKTTLRIASIVAITALTLLFSRSVLLTLL